MKQFTIYAIFLMTVLGLSCQKKKYPESSSQDSPVFYFRGIVNGVPVDLNAGVNNYYMYSAYEQDPNNVYSFNGNLRTENCTSCPASIKISINDYKSSPTGGNVNIDSSLVTAYYPFSIGSSTAQAPVNFTSQFAPFSNHGIASYYWEFGDGSTSTYSAPYHTFKKPGNYLVSLTLTDSGNCSNKISNLQKIGLGGVHASLTASGSSTTVAFSATLSGAPSNAYTYTLNYGDNTYTTGVVSSTTTSSIPAHNYTTSGSYVASLRVLEQSDSSDSTNVSYNLLTQNTSCVTNYLMSSFPVPNPKSYCNITISWTDAAGNQYTSANVSQPGTSYFRILSVEDYSINTDGKKTKKLHVKFKCNVYQTSPSPGNILTIDGGEAVFLVAYQ